MKYRRRKAPVSTLRTRLGERIRDRERDSWDRSGEYNPERPAEPFFLAALFQRMHRYLIIKITVAVVVVFVASLLHRGGYAWGRPLIDGLQFVTSWDMDLSAVPGAIPAFRATWEEWELPFLDPAGETGLAAAPLDGKLKSGFGLCSVPARQQEQMHYGIDLAAPEAAPVRAVLEGRVREILVQEGVATVVLDHHASWQTLYRGLARVEVKEGDTVTQGGLLGTLGTPTLYEQSHLHFELRWNGRPVAPPVEWVAQFHDPAI